MANYYVEESLTDVVSGLNRHRVFGLDVESTGLNPIDSRLLLVQVSTPTDTYVINTARAKLDPLYPFFEDKQWKKLIHKASFDTKWFLDKGVRFHNLYCSMLAEQLITSDPHKGASLAAVTKKYLDIDLDKSARESFVGMMTQAFTQEQLDYAATDSELLLKIYEAQYPLIKEFGLERIAEVEFELAPVVGNMELTGVPILRDKWIKALDQTRSDHEKSRLKMHELIFDGGQVQEQMGMFVRDSINLNSPKQLKNAFQKIGIDLDKTDERTISLINHPAAEELLNYRGLQKLISSYGENLLEQIHPFTNRIHADYQQIGTATGRFACKNPNLQQLPANLRECVGLEDYVVISGDYSNIELRILAELSGDKNFIKAFSSGDDPHKGTASIMFNVGIDQVTKDQRFIAKTINFGISYGMGPNKLMDMLNKGKAKKDQLSFRQVNSMMARYKETYRDAINWLDEAGKRAYRQGYSETMMGRRRWFDRPTSDTPDWEGAVASIKRQGANSPIQGTNADMTKLALLNLYHDLKTYNYKADIILQVHDEIGVLAHKSQAEAVSEVIEESMLASARELLTEVPVKVGISIGDVWKH